jgi:hypothetical protein
LNCDPRNHTQNHEEQLWLKTVRIEAQGLSALSPRSGELNLARPFKAGKGCLSGHASLQRRLKSIDLHASLTRRRFDYPSPTRP